MTRYTATFLDPIPQLTLDTTDRTALAERVTEHAMPYLRPVVERLGRPELSGAFFHPNSDLRGGWFILPDLAKEQTVRFCPVRIEEQQ